MKKQVSLSERVLLAGIGSEEPRDLRGLLRAVGGQRVRDFFWVYGAPGSDAETQLEIFLSEDFGEERCRDGEMTYLEAARRVDELIWATLEEEGDAAVRQFLACLLDVAVLCGEPEILRAGERRR